MRIVNTFTGKNIVATCSGFPDAHPVTLNMANHLYNSNMNQIQIR